MRPRERHLTPDELLTLPVIDRSASASPKVDRPNLFENELAFSNPEIWSGEIDPEIAEHLQQCPECRDLALAHLRLLQFRSSTPHDGKQDASTSFGLDCPTETVWLEYAAGLHASEASSLLSHAAGCSACAETLRGAFALLNADSSPENDIAPPLALASTSPVWQSQLASRMATVARSAPDKKRILIFPPPTIVVRFTVAAGLIVALVLAGLAVWRSVHPSEEQLLALSYNKQRTLALRLPGSEPVAMASITRGADHPLPGMNRTAELSELYTRARQHLDREPDSAYWHQIMGEIDLLDREPKSALHNLEFAQIKDSQLAGLLPDLAAAWFESGEISGQSSDYAQAAELYMEELRNLNDGKPHPASAALLHYNLALCFARQHLSENAREEFLAARAAERSSSWRTSIDGELKQLEEQPRPTGPASDLDRDSYETESGKALTALLPQWQTNPAARARIEHLAQVGKQHGDAWFADWIAQPHSSISQQADERLASAVDAAAHGDGQNSLSDATLAHALYAQIHHQPGMLRATAVQVDAYHRLVQTQRCVEAAQVVEADPRSRTYALIRLKARQDRAICAYWAGDADTTRKELDRALDEEANLHLPQARFSALSMQAAILHDTGQTLASWQQDVTLLSLCNEAACPANRQYSVLYDLVRTAEDLRLPLVADAVMHTAVAVAEKTPNSMTRAYAWETLGRVAGKAGDSTSSREAFAHADRLAHQENAALGALYQAEWKADRAEILALEAKPDQASQLLKESGATMLASDYSVGRVKYFQQTSIAALAQGHGDEAVESSLAAVSESEKALNKLNTADARAQWAREHSAIYGQLVMASLSRGDSTKGLAAWERFRRAPYTADKGETPGRLPLETALDPGKKVIVFALLGEHYFGWLVDPSTMNVIRSANLGDRRALQREVNAFYRLCADHDSSLNDLRELGAKIYGSFFEPLVRNLPAEHLFLDLDPSLSILPLGAVTTPDGRWLADSREITVLPAWWSVSPASALSDTAISRDIRALVLDGFDENGALEKDRSEAVEISRLFRSAILLEGRSSSTAKILSTLSSADAFHFAGHSTQEETSLLTSARSSGEILTPGQIEHAHLQRCRVAILAACNTTAADPDQVSKLPNMRDALLRAGVANVVASSWDVDDDSTRSLMLAFYKQLSAAQPISHALRMAEIDVHSLPRWQHPFYWAGFEHFTN